MLSKIHWIQDNYDSIHESTELFFVISHEQREAPATQQYAVISLYWLIDWLTDWLIDWFIGWVFHRIDIIIAI